MATGASFTLHGAGVAGGIAIGHAHLVSTARLEVAHYEIAPQGIEAEIARFDRAIAQVRGELAALQTSVPAGAPAEMKAILSLHAMLLNDSNLSVVPRELIGSRRCNAEWALMLQMDYLVAQFDEMDDPYLRERKQDIVQVVERVLKAMLGTGHAPAEPSSEKELIVVAHDLSPADMILFKQHQYAGFVTDLGGVTSHTAIVARSLNIPAIVGLHHARSMIWEGELVIVDGREGVLVVNPGARVLEEYRQLRSEIEAERQKLKRLRTARSATMDGVAVELQANIELPQDVKEANEAGAAGIGLFRSEFLFLNRDDLPSEVEQTLAAVRQAKETLDDHKIPYDRRIQIGGMIEVPAAALSLKYFISKLDFLSIGTNDLIQYTLAIDRTDDTVAHLYDPLHPAVLQLIAQNIRSAKRAKTPVAVCGEMAGDAAMTRLLLGFGLRECSMHPAQLLAIKQQVLRTRVREVEKPAARVYRAQDTGRARALLAKLNA